jgi:GntR family transcriptional regulator/MocR family aminotransferase
LYQLIYASLQAGILSGELKPGSKLPSTRALADQLNIAGYRPLREAIAAHVLVSRRVHCTLDQIVIVAGVQGGLDLAARVLVDEGDAIWMEDPGYFGARGAFQGAGARIVPVPVDGEGIDVGAGIVSAPQAKLVYVTPSHQFPLGATLSLARRLQLLDWAKRANVSGGSFRHASGA